jgi:hypothetical protein
MPVFRESQYINELELKTKITNKQTNKKTKKTSLSQGW